ATRKTWVASQPALLIMLGLLLVGGVGLVWGHDQARSAPTRRSTGPSAVLTPSGQRDPNLDTILLELQKVYVRDGADAARQFAEKRLLISPSGVIRLTVVLDTSDKAAGDEVEQQLRAWGVKIDNRHADSMDVSFTLEQVGRALEIPTVGPGTPIAIPTRVIGG